MSKGLTCRIRFEENGKTVATADPRTGDAKCPQGNPIIFQEGNRPDEEGKWVPKPATPAPSAQ